MKHLDKTKIYKHNLFNNVYNFIYRNITYGFKCGINYIKFIKYLYFNIYFGKIHKEKRE